MHRAWVGATFTRISQIVSRFIQKFAVPGTHRGDIENRNAEIALSVAICVKLIKSLFFYIGEFMQSLIPLSRKVFYPLIVLFVWAGLSSQFAHANIIATETLVHEYSAADVRAQLEDAVGREDVLERLQAYGVSPEAAAERVAAMTDQEAQQLAVHFDSAPAGGALVLLLVIVILVLILR